MEEEDKGSEVVEAAAKSFSKIESTLNILLKDCQHPQEVLSGAVHALLHCVVNSAPNPLFGVQMIVSCLDEVMYYEISKAAQKEKENEVIH